MQSEGGGNCGPGGQQAHQVPVEDFEGEGDCEGEVTAEEKVETPGCSRSNSGSNPGMAASCQILYIKYKTQNGVRNRTKRVLTNLKTIISTVEYMGVGTISTIL